MEWITKMDGIRKYDIDGCDITEGVGSGNEVACASLCYAWQDISTPTIFKFEGWVFEWSRDKPFPPHPLKKDGELRDRVGNKFWSMFSRFNKLSKKEQDVHKHLM